VYCYRGGVTVACGGPDGQGASYPLEKMQHCSKICSKFFASATFLSPVTSFYASDTVRTVLDHALCFRAVRAWSHTKSLLARYPLKGLWVFHQIYNFGAVGYKDELVRFLDQ